MSYNKLKNIAISQGNYLHLKELGKTGDSFNFVISKLLTEHGGKEIVNEVSLGSDLGMMGDVDGHQKPIKFKPSHRKIQENET